MLFRGQSGSCIVLSARSSPGSTMTRENLSHRPYAWCLDFIFGGSCKMIRYIEKLIFDSCIGARKQELLLTLWNLTSFSCQMECACKHLLMPCYKNCGPSLSKMTSCDLCSRPHLVESGLCHRRCCCYKNADLITFIQLTNFINIWKCEGIVNVNTERSVLQNLFFFYLSKGPFNFSFSCQTWEKQSLLVTDSCAMSIYACQLLTF